VGIRDCRRGNIFASCSAGIPVRIFSADVIDVATTRPIICPTFPKDSRREYVSSGLGQQVLALAMAGVALAVLVWNVDRPALWLDESASYVARQRGWSQLWELMQANEAPLVPYYALLKVATSASAGVVSSPEVLLRWPSAAVSVLAMWALTLWLVRRREAWLAVGTGLVLLAFTGFSRYGQEARPYAFALAAAVASTLLWVRLSRDRRRRWIGLYAVSVSLLVAAHLLAVALVAAHLVAAVVTASRPERRPALLRTLAGASLGLAAVTPFVAVAAGRGKGPPADQSLTPWHLAGVFTNLLSASRPGWGLGVVLALAAVGATRMRSPRYRFIARLAAAWALVPVAVTLPIFVLRPNLVVDRYLLYVVPAWAVLGGLGILTVAELAGRTSGRLPGKLTAPVAAVLVAGLLVVAQLDSLRLVRTPSGHGEDVRPALAAVQSSGRARLPIVVPARQGAVELVPYDADAVDRLVGIRVQRDLATVWPSVAGRRARHRFLRKHPTVVLLMRAPLTGRCRWDADGPPADYVRRCMPEDLQTLGYRVVTAEKGGRRWTSAVLTRCGGPDVRSPATCRHPRAAL
jgi:mannosyltransferase